MVGEDRLLMPPQGRGTRAAPCRALARICHGRFLCGRRCRDSSRAVAEVTGGTRGVGAARSEATEGRMYNCFADEGSGRVEWSRESATAVQLRQSSCGRSKLASSRMRSVGADGSCVVDDGGRDDGEGHVREPCGRRWCGVRSWRESLAGGLCQACYVAAAVTAMVSAAARRMVRGRWESRRGKLGG